MQNNRILTEEPQTPYQTPIVAPTNEIAVQEEAQEQQQRQAVTTFIERMKRRVRR